MSRKRRRLTFNQPQKNKLNRKLEVLDLKNQLDQMGFHSELKGIQQLNEIMNDFIEKGNSVQGQIELEEHNRIIDFHFSNRVNSKVNLLVK